MHEETWKQRTLAEAEEKTRLYGVSKKLKRLWGSVTVQVLQAQAQPLVKREILPIIIQASCLFCEQDLNSDKTPTVTDPSGPLSANHSIMSSLG